MQPKKHILICIDWYLPGYKAGGPIQSCANLVQHLKNEYDFSILTADTDLGEKQPYPAIQPNKWITLEPGISICYLSKENRTISTIRKHIHEFDGQFIYLNSLFSFWYTILPLWFNHHNKKVIIAPRGMFGKGSLSIKPFKKKLFLAFAKLVGIYDNVIWQASSTTEIQEIQLNFSKKASIKLALNLPPKKSLQPYTIQKTADRLNLFFISRISPVKNLLSAIDYLLLIDTRYIINYTIIGPIEDPAYYNQCLNKINLIQSTKSNITIEHIGPIPNNQIISYLHANNMHALLLPTLNENFGHVILDALSASCPVIISDQTPWKNLQEKQIGYDLPLSDPSQFVTAIQTLASLNQADYNQLSHNAFQIAQATYNNPESIRQNKELFQ